MQLICFIINFIGGHRGRILTGGPWPLTCPWNRPSLVSLQRTAITSLNIHHAVFQHHSDILYRSVTDMYIVIFCLFSQVYLTFIFFLHNAIYHDMVNKDFHFFALVILFLTPELKCTFSANPSYTIDSRPPIGLPCTLNGFMFSVPFWFGISCGIRLNWLRYLSAFDSRVKQSF